MIIKSTRRGIDHRDLAEVAAHVLGGDSERRPALAIAGCSARRRRRPPT
jgi:hypothetical protein